MVSVWNLLDQTDRKIRWKYLYKTAPHPFKPLPTPLSEIPVIKAVTRKGELAKMQLGQFGPSSCNEAWHRRRTETKQGSPAPSAATGAWHCVFLITAKISPGVPSHLLNTGAGGRLPQGSTHRSLCTYCQSRVHDKEGSQQQKYTTSRQYSRTEVRKPAVIVQTKLWMSFESTLTCDIDAAYRNVSFSGEINCKMFSACRGAIQFLQQDVFILYRVGVWRDLATLMQLTFFTCYQATHKFSEAVKNKCLTDNIDLQS